MANTTNPPSSDVSGNESFPGIHSAPVSIINFLRSVQQHHITLSSMADQKASFLVGASVVTLTLVLGQWNKADQGMMLPLFSLGFGSLASAIFAALALYPRSKSTKVKGLSFNPLFFGHFTEMDEEEYIITMMRIIEHDRTIYEAMARDIHQMGKVLRHKKFFYLSVGYRCFVITLLITLVLCIIHFL